MATYTEHYGFTMPENNDFYDIQPINENFETLDNILSENENAIEEIDNKIGSCEDVNTETVFGKLNQIQTATAQNGSFIKSIQRRTFSMPGNGGNDSQGIDRVNPSKCLVIMTRLGDATGKLSIISYELTETNINASASCNASGEVRLEFQIIEFY